MGGGYARKERSRAYLGMQSVCSKLNISDATIVL